jgi:hypothetical protein
MSGINVELVFVTCIVARKRHEFDNIISMLYSEFRDKYNCELYDSGYRLSIKFFKDEDLHELYPYIMIKISEIGHLRLLYHDCQIIVKQYDISDPNSFDKLFVDIAGIMRQQNIKRLYSNTLW